MRANGALLFPKLKTREKARPLALGFFFKVNFSRQNFPANLARLLAAPGLVGGGAANRPGCEFALRRAAVVLRGFPRIALLILLLLKNILNIRFSEKKICF